MDKFSKNKNITHYHSTGSLGYKEFSRLFKAKGLGAYNNLFLSEYIFDAHKYYAAADIIICRAGAATLTELSVLKKPVILVPSPYVTENHQYKNAVALEKEGAAIVIEEKDLTADLLIEKVDGLVSDPFRIADMSKNIGKFGSGGTLELIYNVVTGLKK
jgi:UDP-N-acetylglucosamine--N-acetylmuramyl-(pentapeptide) pyrophosphoryl-undecaprenol N-acetylglucosamine transferase